MREQHWWLLQGSEYQIFLLSTRAGGLGLNLQTAGVHVCLYITIYCEFARQIRAVSHPFFLVPLL
jgi:hypothetical protein